MKKSRILVTMMILFIGIIITGCSTGSVLQKEVPSTDPEQNIQEGSNSTNNPNEEGSPGSDNINQDKPDENQEIDHTSTENTTSENTNPDNTNPDNINVDTKPQLFTYPDAVRGIYVTAHTTGVDRFNSLIELVNNTELNSMVIDIKDDNGYITYKLEGTPFDDFSKPFIKDPRGLIETLQKHNIYPIARIVVFKDTVLANKQPELSFIQDGVVWKNGRQESFVNPFLPEVWKHNVEIAKMAVELGFPEIQFDYVRFPEGFERKDQVLKYSMGEYKDKKPTKFVKLEEEYASKLQAYEQTLSTLKTNYEQALSVYNELKTKQSQQSQADSASESTSTNQELLDAEQALKAAETELQAFEKTKPKEPDFSEKERNVQLRVDAVTDFVAYAKKELEPYGVKVSVDIFGYSATIPEAPGIGQNFERISENVDVISSMIYPSHWGPGYFNIPKPDLEPYRLVQEYVKAENEKLSKLENPPISRPWIQDFTAPWLGKGNYIPYGKKEVEDQIRALHEGGIQEYLLWNPTNRYTENVDYTPLNE